MTLMLAITVKDFPTMFVGCADMANELMDKLEGAEIPFACVQVPREVAMAKQAARTEQDRERLVNLNDFLSVL